MTFGLAGMPHIYPTPNARHKKNGKKNIAVNFGAPWVQMFRASSKHMRVTIACQNHCRAECALYNNTGANFASFALAFATRDSGVS